MPKRSQLPKSGAGRGPAAAAKPTPNTRLLLIIVIGAALLVVAGIVLLQFQAASKPPPVSARTGEGTVWGPADAKVKIVNYSDFGCIHCANFARNVGPRIRAEYESSGNVRFEFKDFIIGGPDTANAANAAECAADQGRFWDYHDLLFSRQGTGPNVFKKASLKQYGEQLGLNTEQFNACVDGDQHLETVYRDSSEGQGQGVTGTPTFFINGERIAGEVPYEQFKARVEAALAAAQ